MFNSIWQKLDLGRFYIQVLNCLQWVNQTLKTNRHTVVKDEAVMDRGIARFCLDNGQGRGEQCIVHKQWLPPGGHVSLGPVYHPHQ